jgi:hypothetical protein
VPSSWDPEALARLELDPLTACVIKC